MNKLITDIVYLDKLENLTTDAIESDLKSRFGEIIRWAIVDIVDKNLKITVTYIKKEA